MPYIKLITGDVVRITENRFNGLKKTGKINPYAIYYDDATGIGFLVSHVVALYRDNPNVSVTSDIAGAETEEKIMKRGRPPKEK